VPLSYQVIDLACEPPVPCVSRVQPGLFRSPGTVELPMAASQAVSGQSAPPGQHPSPNPHGERGVTVERAADAEQGVGEAQLDVGDVDPAAPCDIGIGQVIDTGEQEDRAREGRQQVQGVVVAPVEIVIHAVRPGPATSRVRGG
jgi:hypothetical protein